MEPMKVSRKLLKRLPVYLNYLKNLPENRLMISATAMAQSLGLGDVQVRKDLAKISCQGRRRTGRSREDLVRDIEKYLDYAGAVRTVVVGAGKLGQALLDYGGFEESGLNVMAGFDINPALSETGTGKPIYPMQQLEAFCDCYHVRIGIVAVPADCAQNVCDALIRSGVEAIWNFAPVHLNVPDDVVIQSENLAVSLTALRMQLRERDGKM